MLEPDQDNEANTAAFQRKRDEYFEFGFRDDGQQKIGTPNEAYLSMTCQPVGDEDWMVPYECALGL